MNCKKKVAKFFLLKDKSTHPSCKIYQGDCLCKDDYTGGIERQVATCWDEHDNPTQDSEAAHYLKNHLNRSFNCFRDIFDNVK